MPTILNLPADGETNWGAKERGNLTALQTTADAAAATLATILTPEQYGAVGNNVADDTAAVIACFNAANVLRRITGIYADPGATVKLRGQYRLTTLTAPIDVMCNVDNQGSTFATPSGYTGIAVRVGHTTSGYCLRDADISLPSVLGPYLASPPLPVGSIGVQVRNIYSSLIRIGTINNFETPLYVGGQSYGVAYNTIMFRQLSYGKRMLVLKPIDATGWVNQNTFISGSIVGSTSWAGGRKVVGYRSVVLDGTGATSVNGNSFVGTSFEGDVPEYVLDLKFALNNHFINTRFEQGIAGASFTFSGATITATAHGLSVGNMVVFNGSSSPTGMNFNSPYYVVSVTANTFTVAVKQGGTAVVFSGAGTGLQFWWPPSILYDGTSLCQDNIIDNPVVLVYALDQQFIGALQNIGGNQIRMGGQRTIVDAYQNADVPLHKGRVNGAALVTRPIWGAYPPATNPVADPNGWTTALSDRGVLFGAGVGETLKIMSQWGSLQSRRPADTIDYDVPSASRSAAVFNITALSCAANTTTTTTGTVTGALVGDYVLPGIVAALPAGVVLAQAFVSAADTVTFVFANLTAAAVSVTCQAHAIVWRQFY